MPRCLIASLLAVTLSGAPASIGLISASGPLTVNHASAWGNATLFEGTSVATGAASGDLALRNGVRIQLAAESQAVIGETRETLEKGGSQISAAQNYEIEARGLRIDAPSGARMMVALDSSNIVQVTTLSGIAKVSDRGGLLLASIQPGRSVAFAMPQQAGPTTVQRSGCLLYKDKHFILHDDATNEVVELEGNDLGLNVGKSVQVSGTPTTAKPAVSVATGVINVASVSPRSTGGCLVIAQQLDAQTQVPGAAAAPTSGAPASTAQSAPAAAHTGMSAGAKAGIIIAVAAGGGVGAYVATKHSTSK